MTLSKHRRPTAGTRLTRMNRRTAIRYPINYQE